MLPAVLIRACFRLAWISLSFGLLAACQRASGGADAQSDGAPSLTLAAYTTPREAYGQAILPAFRRQLGERSGKDISIRESYLGSGAQARAIVGGFEADVAALSLEPDIEKLREAGLVSHAWKAGAHGGMVTRSVVVIGVRQGNPKNIQSFQDLARPGVEVLTPNVRTSGGAMWNVLAIYGAALRGEVEKARGGEDATIDLLAAILRNVKIMDRGARESLLTFERGVGDAIITYENEILVGRAQGKTYDYVAPSSTILIENPVAVVDSYAARHGSLELASAFVAFLVTPEAQRSFAAHGLRPVLPSVWSEVSGGFAQVDDLFSVRDLGGWSKVEERVFKAGGVYDRALEKSREATP